MCLVIVFSYLHEFHGDALESLLLEPLDDLSDQTALDAVRLDHDESPLVRHVRQRCWQAGGSGHSKSGAEEAT